MAGTGSHAAAAACGRRQSHVRGPGRTRDRIGVAAELSSHRVARGIPFVIVLVVMLVAGVALTATAKTVDLTVNGQQSTVRTHADTVGEVVNDAGIVVDDADTVSPSLDEPVQDGTDIEVSHARLLTLTRDGQVVERVTTELTLGAALAVLGVDSEGLWVSVPLCVSVPWWVSVDVLRNVTSRLNHCRPLHSFDFDRLGVWGWLCTGSMSMPGTMSATKTSMTRPSNQ